MKTISISELANVSGGFEQAVKEATASTLEGAGAGVAAGALIGYNGFRQPHLSYSENAGRVGLKGAAWGAGLGLAGWAASKLF
jgi:bacteriocin-like protein